MGFSVPRRLRFARCALTAPFHPYHRLAPMAVYFLWHCPSESLPTFLLRVSPALRRRLRSIALYGVRTFLPRLAPGAVLRPSKTGDIIHHKNSKAQSLFNFVPLRLEIKINPSLPSPCRVCNTGCAHNSSRSPLPVAPARTRSAASAASCGNRRKRRAALRRPPCRPWS